MQSSLCFLSQLFFVVVRHYIYEIFQLGIDFLISSPVVKKKKKPISCTINVAANCVLQVNNLDIYQIHFHLVHIPPTHTQFTPNQILVKSVLDADTCHQLTFVIICCSVLLFGLVRNNT